MPATLPPVGSIIHRQGERGRYEVVAHRCGGTGMPASENCPNHRDGAVAVYALDPQGRRIREGAGTQCISAKHYEVVGTVEA